MEIRQDLNQVKDLISRLISIGEKFESMDSDWSHMKNNEDFEKVYSIKDSGEKYKIEEVYGTGRDIAIYMSDALQSINTNFTNYPTLTAIIEKFDGTWIYEDLNHIPDEASTAHDELGINNWAFRQMLVMFTDQLKLNEVIKQTLNLLKKTDLYKQENGIELMSDEIRQSKAIIKSAKITAVALLVAAIIGGVFMLASHEQSNVSITTGKHSTIITGDDNYIDKK